MPQQTKECEHRLGFSDLHVHTPEPGVLPTVYRGLCRECDDVCYLDRDGYIYRTAADAESGENAVRKIGE